MPIFYLDQTTKALKISPTFWIYPAISLPLTGLTLAYWRLSLRQKRLAQKKAASKVNMDVA